MHIILKNAITVVRPLLRPLQQHFHALCLTKRFRPHQSNRSLPPYSGIGRILSHLWNPYPTVPGGLYDIYGRLYTGVGCPYGGIPNLGDLDPFRPQAPYQLFEAQSGNFNLTPLGASGHHVMIAIGNTTVVSYINKQRGTHSLPCYIYYCSVASISGHSPQGQAHPRLSQCDNRQPVLAKTATNDRVESSRRGDLQQ